MKYSSRPKPVRIRLESGGREHFSLDSLLESFNPADLLSKKKELIRWLSTQQGGVVEQLCLELEQIDFNSENVFQLYKIFFGDYITEKSVTNLKDLLLAWVDIDEYNTNVEFLKPFCYQDAETLVNLYNDEKGRWLEKDWKSVIEKYVLTHYIDSSDEHIHDVVQFKEDIDQPILLYFLGNEYFNNGDYSKSKLYLQIALNHDVKEAKAKLMGLGRLGEVVFVDPPILPINFRKELVQEIIDYCIRNYHKFKVGCTATMMLENYIPSNFEELSEEELSFVEFAFDCCYLRDCSDISEKYEEATKILVIDKDDLLINEKYFIINLIGTNCFEGNSKKIREESRAVLADMNYIPAKYISKGVECKRLDNLKFKQRGIDDQICQLLKNIFYFRGNDNTGDIESEIKDKESVRKIIQDSVSNFDGLHWGSSKDMVKDYFAPGRIPQFNNDEWLFFDFAFDCLTLRRYSGYNEKEPKARGEMSKYENSLLKKEAKFIKYLIRYKDGPSYAKSSAKKELIKLDYLPANYILDQSLSNEILDNVNFRLTNIDRTISNFLKYFLSFRE